MMTRWEERLLTPNSRLYLKSKGGSGDALKQCWSNSITITRREGLMHSSCQLSSIDSLLKGDIAMARDGSSQQIRPQALFIITKEISQYLTQGFHRGQGPQ